MNRFELMDLKLRNFKGIKEHILSADGNDLLIKGGNATGKTTLFDSFIWLLFGKDSRNKSDFEIKELDEHGKVKQHGLEHSVEGTFRFDEKVFSLKRVFTENWTKKRGTSTSVFSGHTTKYFIDDVPKKKKEFDEKVYNIISEDVFKLLTNPLYFNVNLGWKERRKILLDISGGVTDEEVAEGSTNKDLTKFIHNLNGRSIDDHKLVINEKRKKINSELDKIPVRMDEIELGMADISNLSRDDLENDLQVVNRQIEQKQEKINDIKSGSEISNQRKELSDIQLELSNIRNEHEQQNREGINELKLSVSEGVSEYHNLQSKLDQKTLKMEYNSKQINTLDEAIAEFRTQWVTENKTEFEHSEDCNCPTCGQELPASQIEEANEKALSNFNKRKAENLERIQRHAELKKGDSEELKAENEMIEKEIAELRIALEAVQEKVNRKRKEVELLEANATDITENEKYTAKLNTKESIENRIIQLRNSVTESVAVFQEKVSEMEQEKNSIQNDISKIEQAERSRNRIKELQEQEHLLSKEMEELDYALYMTDEFTKEKVELLEEKINSKFKYARFKMFSEQINGGLKENCMTTYQGVPYEGGLNNASQINIGLDIIATLQNHYGICAPIFIDNAESVIKLIDIDTQKISLQVSDTKVLEVEEATNERQTA